MIFKVIYNKRIHLVNSSDKQTLQSLRSTLSSLFKSLPEKYALSYIDEDGDDIVLSTQHDFQILTSSNQKIVKIKLTEISQEFMEPTQQISFENVQHCLQLEKPEVEKMKAETKELNNDCIIIEDDQQPEAPSIIVDESMIQERLHRMLPEIISKIKNQITEEFTNKSKVNQTSKISQAQKIIEQNKPVVHRDITCDGCGQQDIAGIRYKCAVCQDYDLCERCESSMNHNHPMLKIRTLEQTPAKILVILNENVKNSSSTEAPKTQPTAGYQNLLNKGIDIVHGLFNAESEEKMKEKFKGIKEEWIKNKDQLKKQFGGLFSCEDRRGCGQQFQNKTQETKQRKMEQKIMTQDEEDNIARNSQYLMEVFDCDFAKCYSWALKYPKATKEELLNICIEQADFFN